MIRIARLPLDRLDGVRHKATPCDESPRQRAKGLRPIVALALIAATGMVLATQPIRSYQYLSPRGIELASGLFGGSSDVGVEYDRMSATQRSTFEAIVHALESEQIDELIVRVFRVWGVAPPNQNGTPADGRLQFRMSVSFVPDIVRRLEQRGYHMSRRGHVLLASGTLMRSDLDVDSARQPGRRPTLQISWLEDNHQLGEVEIDYRAFGFADFAGIPGGHLDPDNSNVMASLNGIAHHQLHNDRYRRGRRLVRWWP